MKLHANTNLLRSHRHPAFGRTFLSTKMTSAYGGEPGFGTKDLDKLAYLPGMKLLSLYVVQRQIEEDKNMEVHSSLCSCSSLIQHHAVSLLWAPYLVGEKKNRSEMSYMCMTAMHAVLANLKGITVEVGPFKDEREWEVGKALLNQMIDEGRSVRTRCTKTTCFLNFLFCVCIPIHMHARVNTCTHTHTHTHVHARKQTLHMHAM